MTITATHDPMSSAHPGRLLDLGQAARVLPGYLGPVVTVAGVRAYGWDVHTDEQLEAGRILVRPAVTTITVRELGDLELALTIAEHRRQAARALRAIVVDVALRSGLTNLRPFARPAGATR